MIFNKFHESDIGKSEQATTYSHFCIFVLLVGMTTLAVWSICLTLWTVLIVGHANFARTTYVVEFCKNADCSKMMYNVASSAELTETAGCHLFCDPVNDLFTVLCKNFRIKRIT